MTLPNNFSGTKQKLFQIWEQSESNRIQIDIQIDKQNAVIKELNRTVIRTFDNNQFITADTEFISPTTLTKDNANKTTSALQTWEIDLIGLLQEELIGVQINLMMRFGDGVTYLYTPLSEGANVFFNKVFSIDNLIDSRNVTKKVLCGFYLKSNDSLALPEINEKNMQVALSIRFINPRYFN